ncbi:hypothetical protein TYRP_012468, partial [Tyrophagus putrescentiae]
RTNFSHKPPENDHVICKLCIHKEIKVTDSKNATNILKKHLLSKRHQANAEEFEKDELAFPYALMELAYITYKEQIQKSVVREGLFAFYLVKTGTPLKAMDSIRDSVQFSGMDRNFRSGRTKTTAVINVCLLKVAIDDMREELKAASSIAIHFDSTTIHNKKILLILAKFYVPTKGIVVKLLDVRNVLYETADNLCSHILEAVKHAQVDLAKIHILCADNTNTNFGGVTQVGYINVGNKIDEQLGRRCFRNGCLGHIVNKASETSIKEFEKFFSMEKITNQTRNFFHQRVIAAKDLQQVAKSQNLKLLPLKRFVITRWTSSHNTLISFKQNYSCLKTYFHETTANIEKEKRKKLMQELIDEKKPEPFQEKEDNETGQKGKEKEAVKLDNFFSEPINYAWVDMMEQIMAKFCKTAQSIQGPNITIMDGAKKVFNLHKFCQNYTETKSALAKSSLGSAIADLPVYQQTLLEDGLKTFLNTSSNYFDKWLGPFQKYKYANWALLENDVSVKEVKKFIDLCADHMLIILYEGTELNTTN